MGYLRYFSEIWKNQDNEAIIRKRMIEWRASDAVTKVSNPLKLDRARALGYKAKQGIFIARVRLLRGGRQRPTIRKGRKPRHRSRRKDLSISYQVVAEQRSQKKFVNCTVLNSYFVAKSGSAYYYEVILVDRAHPQIVSDDRINWICDQRGRAIRGLTSAGRKSRALRGKGKGFEKSRPSRKANYRKD